MALQLSFVNGFTVWTGRHEGNQVMTQGRFMTDLQLTICKAAL